MATYQNMTSVNPVVLMVDDDPDDIYLTRRAFKRIEWQGRFQSVCSAEEMFALLGLDVEVMESSANASGSDFPDIVILDLNMPRTNGFDVIERIRSDERFVHLPIVVLSTSDNDADIQKAYRLGANSFITKPVTTDGMVLLVERFRDYWFGLTRLPVSVS